MKKIFFLVLSISVFASYLLAAQAQTLIPRSEPGDRGKYYLLKMERNGNIITALHERIGPSGTGFTLAQTNCDTMQMRVLGYSESSPQDIVSNPGDWFDLVPGSSKSDEANFVCSLPDPSKTSQKKIKETVSEPPVVVQPITKATPPAPLPTARVPKHPALQLTSELKNELLKLKKFQINTQKELEKLKTEQDSLKLAIIQIQSDQTAFQNQLTNLTALENKKVQSEEDEARQNALDDCQQEAKSNKKRLIYRQNGYRYFNIILHEPDQNYDCLVNVDTGEIKLQYY